MKYENLYPLNTFKGETRKELEDMVEGIIYDVKESKQFLPCGVSQWRAMGESYGYWNYFKADTLEGVKEDIRSKITELTTYAKDSWEDPLTVNEANFAIAQLRTVINAINSK